LVEGCGHDHFTHDDLFAMLMPSDCAHFEFYNLLGGGLKDAGLDGSGGCQACFLPGTTHYDIFSTTTVAALVMPILDAPI
jgi:hypothetical protein